MLSLDCRPLILLYKKNVALLFVIAWWAVMHCSVSLTLCDAVDGSRPGSSVCGDSPGENTGVGCHMPSLSRSSQPTDRIQVSCLAGRFFTIRATGEAQEYWGRWPILSPGDLPRNQSGMSCTAGGFATREAWAAIHRLIFATEKNYQSDVPK